MKDVWQEVTIKDIAVVDWGNTSLTKKAFVSDGPYLGVSAAGCDGRMDHAEHKKHTPVLSAIGAQCGRMIMPEEDFTAIKNTITLTPIDDTCDPFFLYYLMTYVELPQRGAGQPFISKGDIQKFKVEIPPLEEQQRIVAVLDEAFEGLARAHAHAVANLQNARELLAELISRRFGAVEVNGARVQELGGMADFRNGLNFTRTSSGAKIKVVGVGDFKDNFEVPVLDLSSVTIDGELAEADRVQAGDILAVRSNGNRELIGRTMVVPELDEPVSFSGFTIRIRLTVGDISPEYLCEFMKTREARAKLTAGGGGANINNLNQRLLAGFPVYYPELNEQGRILDELAAIRSQAQQLADRYQDQLHDLDDLRQSLLQKAFAGELT